MDKYQEGEKLKKNKKRLAKSQKMRYHQDKRIKKNSSQRIAVL